MRRRIIVTMLAMVVGALALAGLGTFGLVALDSVNQTEAQLRTEAVQFGDAIKAEVVPDQPGHHSSLKALRTILAALKAPLRLHGEALLAVRSTNGNLSVYNLLDPGQKVGLPGGLSPGQLDLYQLIADDGPFSGSSGRLVWGDYLFSVPVPVGSGGSVNLVVLLTREAPAGPPGLLLWVGVASAGTVLVALAVANGLGRRIARPLQRTEAVTRRIASGDLDAQVEVSGREGAELVSLATSVNQMAAELARARGAQRQFLMSVSHDLRTPLTSIKGFAEALSDGATTDVNYAAGVIGTEARRLERLVADLLELAKLESGAFSLQVAPLDLYQVVSEAVQAFEPAAARLGLSLALGPVPETVQWCTADPDRLGQVVANVVENAMKYARESVVVTVRERDGKPSFSVSDDGPGIPQGELERVFERLYQSRQTPGRNLGSGLGLAIVEELVSAMSGQVWAEAPVAPGAQAPPGTVVVVTLAPVPSDVARDTRAHAAPAH